MFPFQRNPRVERTRMEPRRRDVQVASVEPIGPHTMRITFVGEDLADFASPGFDDHVKFMFDGGQGQTVRRDYTPRSFDAERHSLTIEFALHGNGPATRWARAARIGQAAQIGGPRGTTRVPVDLDWHLLAGDGSAMPAIHRRLEELPSGARAIVVLQAGADERRKPATKADLQLHWADNGADWLHALRTLELPPGEGYVWCAGEAHAIAQARSIVLSEKQHPLELCKLAAYWRQGEAGYHEH